MFNLTRVLELTLFGGRDPQSGESDWPGHAATQRDEVVWPTLKQPMIGSWLILSALMVSGCNVVDAIHAEMLPSPLLSLVIDDCIAEGMDVTAGGARYNFSGVQGVQIANVADSLAAVRQAVFDEQWLSAAELLEALRADFGGAEILRQRLSTASQIRQRRRPG